MEEDDKDPEQVGGEAAGVWLFLQSWRKFGVTLWCLFVGGYPTHGTGPGGFLGTGGAATYGEASTVEVGQYMVVHLGGGGKRGGGV